MNSPAHKFPISSFCYVSLSFCNYLLTLTLWNSVNYFILKKATFLKVELLNSNDVCHVYKFEWAVRHAVDIFIQELIFEPFVVFSATKTFNS